jgi:flagellar biosynthesis component FlhA
MSQAATSSPSNLNLSLNRGADVIMTVCTMIVFLLATVLVCTHHNISDHDTTQHDMTHHNMTRHNTTQHDTTRHNNSIMSLVTRQQVTLRSGLSLVVPSDNPLLLSQTVIQALVGCLP